MYSWKFLSLCFIAVISSNYLGNALAESTTLRPQTACADDAECKTYCELRQKENPKLKDATLEAKCKTLTCQCKYVTKCLEKACTEACKSKAKSEQTFSKAQCNAKNECECEYQSRKCTKESCKAACAEEKMTLSACDPDSKGACSCAKNCSPKICKLHCVEEGKKDGDCDDEKCKCKD